MGPDFRQVRVVAQCGCESAPPCPQDKLSTELAIILGLAEVQSSLLTCNWQCFVDASSGMKKLTITVHSETRRLVVWERNPMNERCLETL